MTNSDLMMFRYLNRLRSQGTVNMFGAGSVLAMAFDLDLRDGQKVVTKWMQWVNENPDNLTV